MLNLAVLIWAIVVGGGLGFPAILLAWLLNKYGGNKKSSILVAVSLNVILTSLVYTGLYFGQQYSVVIGLLIAFSFVYFHTIVPIRNALLRNALIIIVPILFSVYIIFVYR